MSIGNTERIIEDAENYQIIETGGVVHYSEGFRVYLMRLPFEQRRRIVNEIEERSRPQRFVRYKKPVALRRLLEDEMQ